ncbi:class I SAM-dependent methyltransferase [Natronolimnohabitans innermongolicus]|uniref:Class I SAM-dependent methyltransferase n=1 Tax=Natronolimnohabitans innermongolicus JCM 12255 TaxID=1227499 RepID=L9XIM8_9EURY|nr:class I SAM-dependent methyltransferase [Natronolimnohabitans innermongolicus]ELY61560.1 hypothetical protein C493_01811 [Natronolimnohabitans innermongolicus JCM 12255]
MTDAKLSFLEAKRTVDDRALNRRVLDRFAAALAARADAADDGEPVRIVEIGAGVGTMIPRLVARGVLPDRVHYRAVDRDRACIERARERVPDRVAAIDAGPSRLELAFETADAFAIDARADAVIGSAILDLVSLERAIPAVEDLLSPEGVLYAPITFDGGTAFAPSDPEDDSLERLYHRHMDDVRDGGSSRAGRELLAALPERDWTVLAAGGSDWVVRPTSDAGGEAGAGGYPASERQFLAHLLETIDDALSTFVPERVAADELDRWLERRRGELEDGTLVAVVHNVDVLARAPRRA